MLLFKSRESNIINFLRKKYTEPGEAAGSVKEKNLRKITGLCRKFFLFSEAVLCLLLSI